ncbi:hypothetical protein Pcinc_017107 [Petrolisthes cinctipes]|uniref:MOSC domain-containing protein n=1 Tax=Petrolisthes cinctipes TaxID=88211 RepID=A0AAE1FRE4_PETCI|nr:hypothetical protein Pcinc_017107 [Petrolisthes cinctipes]
MESTKVYVTASLVTLTAAVLAYWMYRKKPPQHQTVIQRIQSLDEVKDLKWERVGRVSKLCVYMVKSCAPTLVEEAWVHENTFGSGRMKDRCLILVTEKGQMVTGRMIPHTVLVKTALHDDTLTLSFPHTPDLHINLPQVQANHDKQKTRVWFADVFGLDCGDECAQWLEGVLGRKCRLLYNASLPVTRTSDIPDAHKFPLLRNDDQSSQYADLTGSMLMTSESIADLQTRVPHISLDPLNFRPNILVEGTPKPYGEDSWKYIRIGDAVFRNVKLCTRCIFTTIDCRSGKKDPNMEPLRTLREYRCFDKDEPTTPMFGINLGLDLPGTLRVGDDVYVTTM